MPFGYVQVSPDTRTEGWDACSGYHYSDSSIMGFSHTHLSGTGCADLGDLLIMPVTGSLDRPVMRRWKPSAFPLPFRTTNETATPGYYKVSLDKYGVTAELTATAHAAMHRYAFPADKAAQTHLVLDLVHGLASKPIEACLKIEDKNTLTGYRRSGGWANGKTVYFVIESSAAVQRLRSGSGRQTAAQRPV